MANTITVTKGLIAKEDVAFEDAGATADQSFTRSTSTGGTQSLVKIGATHIPIRDVANYFTATNVEAALAELAPYFGKTYLHSGYPMLETGQVVGLTYATSFDWFPAS